MNDFFKCAWSFPLSQVIEIQKIHQGKVNSEVVSFLDSCDLSLKQRRNLLFENMFEKLTMFHFKFLLVCSLICSLPVISCKDDLRNLDGILKTIFTLNLHVAHIEHKTKDFQTKIFQTTSEKHWQKNLRNILEFFL